jgi:type III secretion protein N (ATPase)
VLLLVDSITRFARAQREIGPRLLASLPRGAVTRPASSRSYRACSSAADKAKKARLPPSTPCWSKAPTMDEPIADEVRGILDGHIVLDRRSPRAVTTRPSTCSRRSRA